MERLRDRGVIRKKTALVSPLHRDARGQRRTVQRDRIIVVEARITLEQAVALARRHGLAGPRPVFRVLHDVVVRPVRHEVGRLGRGRGVAPTGVRCDRRDEGFDPAPREHYTVDHEPAARITVEIHRVGIYGKGGEGPQDEAVEVLLVRIIIVAVAGPTVGVGFVEGDAERSPIGRSFAVGVPAAPAEHQPFLFDRARSKGENNVRTRIEQCT